MDASTVLLRMAFRAILDVGLSIFTTMLLLSLMEISYRSPVAMEVLDFVASVFGVQQYSVIALICLLVFVLCLAIPSLIIRLHGAWVEEFIKKYTTLVFCMCALSHTSAYLIPLAAGTAGRGHLCGVISVSGISIVTISGFKLLATSRDSSCMARFVMAQSTSVAFIMLCQAYFLEAMVAIFPSLLAIFALRTPVDKLYYHPYKHHEILKGGAGENV